MKYQAKQMHCGKFAVFAGKKYFKATVTDNLEDAELEAAYRSADWHIEKAMELLPKMSLQRAKNVAQFANELVDQAVDRARDEDPDFDELDPRAFLC